MSASINHGGSKHDVMPDCRLEGAPLNAASFHMLPYSNRIRDGRFSFNDRKIQLDEGDRHAIHGALRNRSWRVSSRNTSSIRCEYDTGIDGPVNWPWAIHAVIGYSLDGYVLRSTMELTNNDTTAMPAGMGWHPYFSRLVGSSRAELRIPVSGVYPDNNGDLLPVAAALPVPGILDFTTDRLLEDDQRIDHCFNGLNAPISINWRSAGIQLIMQASENCDHLVLFNPDAPHFAVEPVSNANDAFNLHAKGIDAGMRILNPGETMRAWMNLTLAASQP